MKNATHQRKMRNIWTLLAVVLAVSLLLAACGGEPGAEEAASGGGGDEPTPIPAVATPTPKPLPPTPTPRPSPTLVPVEESEAEEAEEEEVEAEPAKPLTEMVEIPAGAFTMGLDEGEADERPAHEVELPAYYIEILEVTNAQFAAFVEDTGYTTESEKGGGQGWKAFAEGKDNHPVVKVSWNDATAYCEWAGRRLPTEAEWEKAARGMEGNLYPWGNEWDISRVNAKESGYRGTTPVGLFGDGASPYGVLDMSGNVWEWTADWYQAYPGNTVEDEFYGEEFKVLRGGGWFNEKAQLATTNRSSSSPEAANDDIGFRCAGDAR